MTKIEAAPNSYYHLRLKAIDQVEYTKDKKSRCVSHGQIDSLSLAFAQTRANIVSC